MASYGSSIASGAGTGAAIGTEINPGWGTVIGAAAGGILGGIGAYEDEVDQEEYNKRLKQAAQQYGISLDEAKALVDAYYKNKGSLLDSSDKKEYKEALTDTDWESLGTVDFDKSKYNVEDYYDQNRNQIVKAAQADALGSANISGSLLGSGAVGQQINAAVSTEKDLADKAYNRMVVERNFDYGLAKDSASQHLEAVKNKISALGTAYASDEQNDLDYLETILGINQAKAQANLTAYMQQQV